jgi:DNA-binding HxlR family transcriptional regulator
MEGKFRCDCPATCAIDIVGDKWSLVIIKQMLIEDKKTFKDFTESDEAIASNILSSRLKMLEGFNIIRKEKLPENKKTNIYTLTEMGLGLTPTIVELILWSDLNLRELQPIMQQSDELELMKNNKEGFISLIKKNYRENMTKKISMKS